MKKLFCLLSLMLLCLLPTRAALRMDPSGTRDMLIRLQTSDRYLILPIEEAAPEYLLRIIQNGTCVRELKLRLAANGKIDYYVPLDLSAFNQQSLILDVHVWEEQQMTWVAFDKIHTAATTDGCINAQKDPYCPLYHHTPTYGWMNDPNGMFYHNGRWHLYYQWNPYCSLWQNMTWGHSSSTDLLHWDHHAAAIEPDALGTIFSGSAAVDKEGTAGYGPEAVVAMYTASEFMGQSQCLAWSTDEGMTFRRYEGNPTVTAPIPDFRDPNFFWNEQTHEWNLVLASGQEMRFYASTDLKQWHYLSSFGKGYGCHGGVWECPDLMQLPVRGTNTSKWVLLCNINPGGPFGGSATQYFVGEWDGHTFTCEHTDTRWMDYGKDHYATVSFSNAPEGRHTMMVWMSNWQYANQVPTRQFRSANALPRDVDLYKDSQGRLIMGVRPAPECQALRGAPARQLPPAAIVEVVINRSKQPATITLSNDKGEQVVMTYDFSSNTFSFDRTRSGLTDFSADFPSVTQNDLYVVNGKYKLLLFIDKCSIEAFDGDGHWAQTNLVFPSEPYNKVTCTGSAKATICQVNY